MPDCLAEICHILLEKIRISLKGTVHLAAARQVVVAAPVLADQTLAVVQAPVTPVPLRDLLLTAAAAILVAARAIKSILA